MHAGSRKRSRSEEAEQDRKNNRRQQTLFELLRAPRDRIVDLADSSSSTPTNAASPDARAGGALVPAARAASIPASNTCTLAITHAPDEAAISADAAADAADAAAAAASGGHLIEPDYKRRIGELRSLFTGSGWDAVSRYSDAQMRAVLEERGLEATTREVRRALEKGASGGAVRGAGAILIDLDGSEGANAAVAGAAAAGAATMGAAAPL